MTALASGHIVCPIPEWHAHSMMAGGVDEMSNKSGFQLAGTGPESYERYIGVDMAPFVDAVIQRAKLARGDAVLDVACGTGFVARAASSLGGSTGRVAGLDINPGMLEVARAASANACRTSAKVGHNWS